MAVTGFDTAGILNRILQGHPARENEIRYLLGLENPEDIDLLFETARAVRSRLFQDKIFFYGFVYFSTYCRNSCRFCQYRVSNRELHRYRKTKEEILSAARELALSGVHLIDLTMGEDPELYDSIDSGFHGLVEMVRQVGEETGLPVMVSPGAVPDQVIEELAEAGGIWYACYQETYNRKLYEKLRCGQSFDDRLTRKRLARKYGLLIEEGLLTGVGESLDDLVRDIVRMRDTRVDQARIMSFVPQAGTPMESVLPQSRLRELVGIAVMRLVMPDCLIPASLDVDGLSGLKVRLDAGANVVTSIVPPRQGLAGVANPSLDIEASRRTLDVILPILEQCGLTPATSNEYGRWIRGRQAAASVTVGKKKVAICE